MRARRALSLPHEHGAWLTGAGALALGLGLAPAGPSLAAAGAGLSLAVAMVARGPIEQLAVGRPARLDRAAVAPLLGLGVIGARLAARAGSGPGLLALGLVVAGAALPALARLQRVHRRTLVEVLAMAGLGGAALPLALAGGASLGAAALPSLALAAHAAATVPIVRAEVRPRERALRGRAEAIGALLLVAAAALLVALGRGRLGLALAPRLALVAAGRLGLPPLPRAAQVGVRETGVLAAVVAILLALA